MKGIILVVAIILALITTLLVAINDHSPSGGLALGALMISVLVYLIPAEILISKVEKSESVKKGGEKMKRILWKSRLIIGIVVALMMVLIPATGALAANPTVTITVTAGLLTITNSEDTWAIGYATPSEVTYFSATGAQDDDYSMVINTGNLAVDVEIQGVNFEGGSYDWTLGAASGNQTYSLYANKSATPTVYDTEVKSSSYTDLTTDLAASANVTWSMKFTAPNEFHASDNGAEKSATVTLVASEHV